MLEVEEGLVAEKVMRARELLEVKHLIDPEHRFIRGGKGEGEKMRGTGNKKGKMRRRGKKGKKGKRQGRGRGKDKEK